MAIVLVTFVIMLMVVAAMAVGAIMGRKPIAGSCGGMSAVGIGGACACGKNPGSCGTEEESSNEVNKTNFYDASN